MAFESLFIQIYLIVFGFYFIRNVLQVNKNDLSDKVIDCEKENEELKTHLDITTRQYNNKCNDFENSQSELKKSRREIDVSSD